MTKIISIIIDTTSTSKLMKLPTNKHGFNISTTFSDRCSTKTNHFKRSFCWK